MINKDPQKRELAVFGAALAGFFLLAGFVSRREWGADGMSTALWAAGAAVTFLYAAAPPLRRPMFIGWAYLTYPLGWAVSHLVLLAVFWVVITPIGLLVRVFGHDALSRAPDPPAKTYWLRRDNTPDPGRYFQQS